jgi:hypothetical protein
MYAMRRYSGAIDTLRGQYAEQGLGGSGGRQLYYQNRHAFQADLNMGVLL